jgi:hypothetical protein
MSLMTPVHREVQRRDQIRGLTRGWRVWSVFLNCHCLTESESVSLILGLCQWQTGIGILQRSA